MESGYLKDEEINAYVQHEAGNTEYFKMSEEKYAEIGKKIRSSDLNQNRYERSKEIYNEIAEIKEERKIPFLAIAASVILLLVFSSVYYFGGVEEPNNNMAINDINLPTAEELTARYGLNETLDNRVNYPLRSVSISNIKPENNSVFKEEVKFSWGVSSETSLTLKVYDKSEKLLFKKASNDGEITWKIPQNDVYYFSLEDEFEVFYWGKLFGLEN